MDITQSLSPSVLRSHSSAHRPFSSLAMVVERMPEEYIMSSKACVYVLGGASNTAALFDFDGVYILDGGFAENTSGFVAHVRNVSAVLLSSPTLGNLGTTASLLEQDKPLPVFFNVKPIKNAKPGSSGEVVKNIQEANSKLLSVALPLFNPKYSPHIIYHSAAKGILSLYVLAGDTKDAEVLTKALVGGNEAEVEKAAADHGTIGVLLWRPAQADKPAVRVLISGTSSLVRIQQSLDKAAKSLPFLNAPIVKSKDALSDIPPPVVPRPLASAAGKLPARSVTSGSSRTATVTTAAPRPLTSRAQANGNPAIPKTAVATARNAPTRTVPATSKPPTKVPAKSSISAKTNSAKAPGKPQATGLSTEPVALKKTLGKVQGAAPSKTTSVKIDTTPTNIAPVPKPEPTAEKERAVDPLVIKPSDYIISEDNRKQRSADEPVDVSVIRQTPEPPQHEEETQAHTEKSEQKVSPDEATELQVEVKAVESSDLAGVPNNDPQPKDGFENVESDNIEDKFPDPVSVLENRDQTPKLDDPGVFESNKDKCPESAGSNKESPPETEHSEDVEDKIPEPVDAFKKPEPSPDSVVLPNTKLDDIDSLISTHPEPSAPEVPNDHAINFKPDPKFPDVAVAVPFIPLPPREVSDGLIQLDDEKEKIAPGFEKPLIADTPLEDGTLPDCKEEISKLIEISMDTDSSTKISSNLDKTIEDFFGMSADKQSLGLDEKTDEYVRKLSTQMIEDATLPFTSALANSIASVNGSQAAEPNGHSTQDQNVGIKQDILKHDLMQSRSSVIENGAQINYEETDPALDDVLDACTEESEKLDAAASSLTATLHMPAGAGTGIAAKPVKFARPYYFDVVTVPRNQKLETSVPAESLQEFIAKVRSRNVILASKGISSEHFQAILSGKQSWSDSVHPCNVIPTHSSPTLLDFRQKNEEHFPAAHLSLSIPVEKQRTTVSSEAGAVEYELARITLE